MANKRYYWLKLQQDFFDQKEIKKLRKIAGGDTYVIIYLKMQLKSLRDGGVLQYTGIESSFAEELALDLDEEVDNVTVTLQYLSSRNMIETSDDINFLLPSAVENTGSESDSAKRMREFRERQNNTPALQVSSQGITCAYINDYKLEERHIVQESDTDIEEEKERYIDTEREDKKRFKPPTVDEVREYIIEKGYHIDAEAFIAFYQSKGWKVGNQQMKDWKSAVVTWEKRYEKEKKEKQKPKAHQLSEEMTHDYDMDELRKRAKL